MPFDLEQTGPHRYRVDGVEFQTFAIGTAAQSTSQRFLLGKPDMTERFSAILRAHAGGNIIDLGIFQGGSVAFAALIAQPRKLVAVDLDSGPCPALEEFIRDRHLDDSIRPLWGVDQADRSRLQQIVAEEFDGPLDLVIDDASHRYEPTVASFETLFPLLRPGGTYLIEDWRWDLLMPTGKTPLVQVAVDLLGLLATSSAVAGIVVDQAWVAIRRGPGDLPSLRLDRLTIESG